MLKYVDHMFLAMYTQKPAVGDLHLKFSYISLDLQGTVSPPCVIIRLLMGEKESLFIFTFLAFFPGLFFQIESQQRGMKL